MIRDTTGGHVAKRQLEELTIRAAQDFDAFYELRHARAYPNQDSGPILVISADGKGVVMRPCDLREPTRKAAEARTRKMGTRLSKGEKKNAKRMATVAAVYTIMPFVRQPEDLIADSPFQRQGPAGPRPEQKRVWASLEKDPEQVIAEAVAEARYRDPCGKKKLGCPGGRQQGSTADSSQDGQEKQARPDHHCRSYSRHRVLVEGGMRRSATVRGLSAQGREPVDKCATYLLNHTPCLRYDRYLAQGFPVATGVIEGACRHLVKDRMEKTGARWSLSGAEAVLRLRALRASCDFEEYWRLHETCEYERNHKNLYAAGEVPPVSCSRSNRKSSHLKVIK
jgi:hypothetical protein